MAGNEEMMEFVKSVGFVPTKLFGDTLSEIKPGFQAIKDKLEKLKSLTVGECLNVMKILEEARVDLQHGCTAFDLWCLRHSDRITQYENSEGDLLESINYYGARNLRRQYADVIASIDEITETIRKAPVQFR